jgi:hypothetical protein
VEKKEANPSRTARLYRAARTMSARKRGGWLLYASGSSLDDAVVDGRHLTTFTDRERPHPGGAVGLYTEDAEAEFRDVEIGAHDP